MIYNIYRFINKKILWAIFKIYKYKMDNINVNVNDTKINGYDTVTKEPENLTNVADYYKYLMDIVDNLDEIDTVNKTKLKSSIFTVGVISNSCEVHNKTMITGQPNPLIKQKTKN